MNKTTKLLAIVLTAALAGCATHPATTASQGPPAPPGFNPYVLSMAQRALLTPVTNYVDREVVKLAYVTNVVEKQVTNLVERVVEKPVLVSVPGATTLVTNTISVTNFVPMPDTVMVETVTAMLKTNMEHIAASIDVVPNKVATGVAAGVGVVPGWGQLAGAGFLGALGLWGAYTKRKLNQSNDFANQQAGLIDQHENTNGTLAQEIEAGMETLRLMASTQQGTAVVEKYKDWLQSHQKEAGIIGTVSTIVNESVDNDAARFVAAGLVGTIAAPTGQVPPAKTV